MPRPWYKQVVSGGMFAIIIAAILLIILGLCLAGPVPASTIIVSTILITNAGKIYKWATT